MAQAEVDSQNNMDSDLLSNEALSKSSDSLPPAEYERRLDRSAESEAFQSMTPADKQLVSQLRAAMLGVRDRVGQLQDQADDRERDAEREAALRRAAESRLDQLVDMYADPSVMEELQTRLPKASGSDNTQTWKRQLHAGDPDTTTAASGTPTKHENAGAAGDPDHTSGSRKRSHSPPLPPPGSESVYPPGFRGYYPPVLPYPQVVYMAQAPANGAPGAPFMIPVQVAAAAQDGSGSAGSGAATTVIPTGTAGSSQPTAVRPTGPEIGATSHREQNRQISLLLAELDAARDLNKKLQTRLSSTQQELQKLKITSDTKESKHEAELSGKVAAIVEEVYKAQRERDQAMMGRLRTANEERDDALLRLRNLEYGINEFEAPESEGKDNMEVELKALLSELSDLDSNVQVDQHGRRLVDAINRQRQRKREITAEEMKAVLAERDRVMDKSQRQEAEILRLQRQLRGRTPDKQQQATLQAKLLTVQQERDLAVSKVRKMEDELQTLRVYYSLHKSLSQEANLRDQFNNTLESYEGQLKHRDSAVDQAQKENNRLVAQLRASMTERASVEGELAKAQGTIQGLQDSHTKLEKVITLLRERVKESSLPAGD